MNFAVIILRFTRSPLLVALFPENITPLMEAPSPSPAPRPASARMPVALMARWGEHFFAVHIRRRTSKGNYEMWWDGQSVVLPEDIVWSPPSVSLPPPPMSEVQEPPPPPPVQELPPPAVHELAPPPGLEPANAVQIQQRPRMAGKRQCPAAQAREELLQLLASRRRPATFARSTSRTSSTSATCSGRNSRT